jgi:hypothetical protein
MPVFVSSKKKTDEYLCRIFTMDAELQFTVEVSNDILINIMFIYISINFFRQQQKVIHYFLLYVKQLVLENIGILVLNILIEFLMNGHGYK